MGDARGIREGVFDRFWLEGRRKWEEKRSKNYYRLLLLSVGLRDGVGFVDRTGIFDGVFGPWKSVSRSILDEGVGVICTRFRDGEAAGIFFDCKIKWRFSRIAWRSTNLGVVVAGGDVRCWSWSLFDVPGCVEIYNGRSRRGRPWRKSRQIDWNRKSKLVNRPVISRESIDKSYRTGETYTKRLELLKQAQWSLEISETREMRWSIAGHRTAWFNTCSEICEQTGRTLNRKDHWRARDDVCISWVRSIGNNIVPERSRCEERRP